MSNHSMTELYCQFYAWGAGPFVPAPLPSVLFHQSLAGTEKFSQR